MSPEKEITIGFMITFSENPDKILDSICSPADVDHLISKRIEYAKTQKAENLTKDPHVSITSNTSSHNCESINTGLELTQESVDTEIIENSNSDSVEEIQILRDMCAVYVAAIIILYRQFYQFLLSLHRLRDN